MNLLLFKMATFLTYRIPELLTWIKKFQMHFHQPPIMQDNYSAGFDACITAGSQDGLGKVLDMLLSPGDNLLVENQLYSGTLSYVSTLYDMISL